MALSINGIYNIYEISRESFEKEAVRVGLGSRMAMKRFDAMTDNFVQALELARKELEEKGFAQVSEISTEILKKGGIAKYI